MIRKFFIIGSKNLITSNFPFYFTIFNIANNRPFKVKTAKKLFINLFILFEKNNMHHNKNSFFNHIYKFFKKNE